MSLTEKGRQLVDEVVTAHVANEHRLLRSLDKADQDALANLLRKLLLSFEQKS